MAQQTNTDSEFLDFTALTYGEIENIYQKAKFENWPIILFAAIIALLFALFNIIKAYQENLSTDSKDSSISIGTIFKLFREKWKFLMILFFLPLLFSLAEGLLGGISDYYLAHKKEPEGNIYNALIDQLVVLQERESKEDGFWTYSIADIIDYGIALGLQPFIVLIQQWTYSMAIMYRFFFLSVLELLAPVAMACLLYEKTQQFFFNWGKAMIICYLLIPVFMLADYMSNTAMNQVILNTPSGGWIFNIVVMFTAVKILLMASSKVIMWRML